MTDDEIDGMKAVMDRNRDRYLMKIGIVIFVVGTLIFYCFPPAREAPAAPVCPQQAEVPICEEALPCPACPVCGPQARP